MPPYHVIEHEGVIHHTGLLMPVMGTKSTFPVFEDSIPMLTTAQVTERAKSGKFRGKGKFGSEYILNQQTHGSCAGHGGAGALARARVRRGLPQVILSGAYPYSKANGGQDNGAQLADIMNALMKYGDCPLALVNWDEIYPNQQPPTADAEAAKNKAFEAYAVGTQEGLWAALALGFDVVVAVDACDAFMELDGEAVAGSGPGPGNHCVATDGLFWTSHGLTADGFNSWGTTYGDQGRMGLTWEEHFANPFNYHTFYAIRSSTDSPDGPNPPN